MQATTLTTLRNIARAGSRKMDSQNYTIAPSTVTANVYRVTNPDGETYRVSTKPGASSCGCKFYNEHRYNPATKQGFTQDVCTCKHIEKCREEEAYLARIDREAAEIEAREWEQDFNLENGYLATASVGIPTR